MKQHDNSSAELYLDLLKRAITFSLWQEPPIPASAHFKSSGTTIIKRKFNVFMEKAFHKLGREIVKPFKFTDQDRDEGKIWSGYAHSMIGRKRLNNIHECIKNILADQVPGDFIEAGVWRGGATIFMKGCLKAYGNTKRKVFVADSFEGLPRPDEGQYSEDSGDEHYAHSFLSVSLNDVRNNFEKYALLDDRVIFLKGWFKDTLPDAPINKLALLRADGDMYESTMDILNNLYPKLSNGGYCIIDDYALAPCKKAVSDYRAKHGIDDKIIEIDWTGIYWKKSSN